MLSVSNLSKRYGDTLLFDRVNLVVNHGERVALVGPNGCGKTTLLRILMAEEPADSGSVTFAPGRERVGYLPQALSYPTGTSVQEVLRPADDLDERLWATRLEALAEALARASPDARAGLEQEYAHALECLQHASATAGAHLVDKVLAGLGLDGVDRNLPVARLSGGQKTRLGLARILLQQPVFLILDEPTNHLDIGALEWLEDYLRGYDGGILFVSHDRAFLDRVAERIVEIDSQAHQVHAYVGNYSAFIEAQERAKDKLWRAYQDQEERIEQLEDAVRGMKTQARNIEQETIHFHYRKKAKKVARRAVVQAKRIERMIEAEDHLEKPVQGWEMKLEFAHTPPSGQDVLVLQDVGKAFGALELFRHVRLTLRQGERVALVGPNGCGKTTLLRLITGEEPPSEGSIRLGANVRPGYLAQEQEALAPKQTPLAAVQAAASIGETEARNFLHYFLFAGDDVFTPIDSLSFGERARLALATLVLRGCNLLLLDEPINHLDIPSRERFERALAQYQGTVLAVVHDRYFIQRFATSIWAMAGGTVRRFADLADARRGQAQLGAYDA